MKKKLREFIEKIMSTKGRVKNIPISLLHSNPYQMRHSFSEEQLTGLAESIKEYGVVQPIIVRKYEDGYQIVCGERRVRACKKIGLKNIPALVRDSTEKEMLEMAFLENLQRENLNYLEEAETYSRLLKEFENLSIEELSKKIGKSVKEIKEKITFLELPLVLKKAITMGMINYNQAKLLRGIKEEYLFSIIKEIYAKELSTKEIKELLKEKEIKLEEVKDIDIDKELILLQIKKLLKELKEKYKKEELLDYIKDIVA